MLDNNGNPFMSSGNYAVVFKMTDGEKDYAVKCFTREQEGREEAYKLISAFLVENKPYYFVNAQYMDKELFVSSTQTAETEFPVLLMDWVEGETLDKFVENNITHKETLHGLYRNFVKLAKNLIGMPFAHGDIKPDNIIVKKDGTIALLDYDGMYVPSMYGQHARELGTPEYRHPMRSTVVFDEHIDDYALVVIGMCLRALVVDPLGFRHVFKDVRLSIERISDIKCDTLLMQLYAAYLIVLTSCRIEETSACLLINVDVEYNYEQERQLLHLARNGDISAMNQLGGLYDKGILVPQDKNKAIFWFGLASLLGDRNAMLNYKSCLYKKMRLCISNDNYLEHLNQLVISGNLDAITNLGNSYYYGQGVTQDYAEAVNWYRKAAEQGDASAQYNLGFCYDNGQGVEQDYAEAVNWYRKAAEQGDASAQYNLGCCYYNGQGVEQDYAEAVNWYRKAAEQGDCCAQCFLGVCYEYGKGCEKDIYIALIWLKKAAEQGKACAKRKLGYCYEHSENSNVQEALKWYKDAAEQGDETAKQYLQKLQLKSQDNN